MKKLFVLIIAVFLTTLNYAQNPGFVQAQLSYITFYSPADGPYIETYLSVVGGSIVWVKNEAGHYQGKLEVTMIFKKGEEITAFDKYELSGPAVNDSLDRFVTFLDQQRFLLSPGEYAFEIILKDLNSNSAPFSASQTITVQEPGDDVAISGIQLLESFTKTENPTILTKNGYDLVPYVYNFIPEDVNTLSFYAEIYNTDKVLGQEEGFLISHYIQTYESKRTLEKFSGFRREKSAPVNILLTNYNITELPSGNYNLVVEARNKENQLITSQKLFFQRSNPGLKVEKPTYSGIALEGSFASQITSRDTLMEYIRYLTPIASDIDNKFIKHQIENQNADITLMQRFFLNFWLERNELNPEIAWRNYLSNVQLVNEQFGAPGNKGKKGYQTDMGYVYLKYGPPNTITDRPYDASTSGMTLNPGGSEAADMGSVPYQIWHYYTLNGYRDRKFVFANKHLALFDYQLIHSNMPGEVQNENWQAELHLRFNPGGTMPDSDKYKGRSGDYYNNPR